MCSGHDELQWLGDDEKIDSFTPESELDGTPNDKQRDEREDKVGIELFFGHDKLQWLGERKRPPSRAPHRKNQRKSNQLDEAVKARSALAWNRRRRWS